MFGLAMQDYVYVTILVCRLESAASKGIYVRYHNPLKNGRQCPIHGLGKQCYCCCGNWYLACTVTA